MQWRNVALGNCDSNDGENNSEQRINWNKSTGTRGEKDFVFFDASVELNTLKDTCRTSKGDKILASHYNYGQVTYAGTVFLLAFNEKQRPYIRGKRTPVVETDISSKNNEDVNEFREWAKKFTLLYKTPCSFTINVDKEGCTTVQNHQPTQNHVKFQTNWLGKQFYVIVSYFLLTFILYFT
jgi:hypothetical protein